jgi:hypothetical protein
LREQQGESESMMFCHCNSPRKTPLHARRASVRS